MNFLKKYGLSILLFIVAFTVFFGSGLLLMEYGELAPMTFFYMTWGSTGLAAIGLVGTFLCLQNKGSKFTVPTCLAALFGFGFLSFATYVTFPYDKIFFQAWDHGYKEITKQMSGLPYAARHQISKMGCIGALIKRDLMGMYNNKVDIDWNIFEDKISIVANGKHIFRVDSYEKFTKAMNNPKVKAKIQEVLALPSKD